MKDEKPEWYARLRKGPFEETVFDSKMQQSVAERTWSGAVKPAARRWKMWATAGALVVFLVCALILVPLLNHQFSPYKQASGSAPSEMTQEFVREHLKPGMTMEEVTRILGNGYEEQSIRRDFSQSHQEKLNDMKSWSEVDIWRYDYGVLNGYKVQSDLQNAKGFDMPGIKNGSIAFQLVFAWKGGKAVQVGYAYKTPNGYGTDQLGPNIEDGPPSSPPATAEPDINPQQPNPGEGVRAVGDSTFGIFQLRPKKDTEEISPLSASCWGQEMDLNFFGDYELYFQTPSGEEKLIQDLPQLELIQRENKTIEFVKYDFSNMELFLFYPRYTDCHGKEFYAYGVDRKTGAAFPFTFQDGDNAIPYWTSSPQVAPIATDTELIVEGGRAAGTDGATRYHFKPDLTTHQMLLESKEQIP